MKARSKRSPFARTGRGPYVTVTATLMFIEAGCTSWRAYALAARIERVRQS